VLAPFVDLAALLGLIMGDARTTLFTWFVFLALQLIPGWSRSGSTASDSDRGTTCPGSHRG
jgi:hypothetical protein